MLVIVMNEIIRESIKSLIISRSVQSGAVIYIGITTAFVVFVVNRASRRLKCHYISFLNVNIARNSIIALSNLIAVPTFFRGFYSGVDCAIDFKYDNRYGSSFARFYIYLGYFAIKFRKNGYGNIVCWFPYLSIGVANPIITSTLLLSIVGMV